MFGKRMGMASGPDEGRKALNGEKTKYTRWFLATLGGTTLCLAAAGWIVYAVDPFFHFHKPLENLAYPIDMERYQNDGISRHFSYNAVMTGTSMTENFKASRFDELFGVHSIKIPFGGATYKETGQAIARAISYNPGITTVLCSLDSDFLMEDKDAWNTAAPDTEYLYDDNPWNDVNYIWNKEVLFGNVKEVLENTRAGGHTTDFDEYMHWAGEKEWGKEAVLRTYGRVDDWPEEEPLTEEERRTVMENVEQNVLSTARENPEVTFYYFIPPYSIGYWESEIVGKGMLSKYIAALKLETDMLLSCENIRLFAFDDQYDITCNLDNYMDVLHYSESVGDQLIAWMAAGEHRLTKDNAEAYYDEIEAYYRNYDYDSIHE